MNEVGASASPFLKILALRWLKIADAGQKLATISKNYQRYEQRMVIYKTTEKPKHHEIPMRHRDQLQTWFSVFLRISGRTVGDGGMTWRALKSRKTAHFSKKGISLVEAVPQREEKGKKCNDRGNKFERTKPGVSRSKPWPWPSCSFAEEFPGSSLRSIVNARRLIHDASFSLRA